MFESISWFLVCFFVAQENRRLTGRGTSSTRRTTSTVQSSRWSKERWARWRRRRYSACHRALCTTRSNDWRRRRSRAAVRRVPTWATTGATGTSRRISGWWSGSTACWRQTTCGWWTNRAWWTASTPSARTPCPTNRTRRPLGSSPTKTSRRTTTWVLLIPRCPNIRTVIARWPRICRLRNLRARQRSSRRSNKRWSQPIATNN